MTRPQDTDDPPERIRRGLWPALRTAGSQWIANKDPKAGAAIAYYSIFSIGPLIVVVITIASLVFEREGVQAEIPCHAAETLPGLAFPSVRGGSLADIWYRSEAFNRFRGTDWMVEPCRSCERREIDWGGCRCQAFRLAGDASRADPVCALSPDHGIVEAAIEQAESTPDTLVYRHYS
jgi:radical SAM protein with 4Fe4S-binding SPASM domain